MKHVMGTVKFLIGLFPKKSREKMRQQIWLHNLYSKSLQKSGLFYGFPSPQKLQKLYVKNIAKQEKLIKSKVGSRKNKKKINCLIVLTGQRDADVQTIQNILLLVATGKIFLAGEKDWVRYCCSPFAYLAYLAVPTAGFRMNAASSFLNS